MRRRTALAALAAVSSAAALPAVARTPRPALQVFKNESCGCCSGWVDHMKAAGFAVAVTHVDDTAIVRKRVGMPDRFGACHTATVAGYVVEGHVPAAEVERLLALKPAALGLAVPSMPPGSPGMEVGDRHDPYRVFLVGRDGSASVFANYPKT